MNSISKYLVAAIAAPALLGGCSSEGNGWKLQGVIDGGAGKQLIVETQTFVGWTPVDTAVIADDGSFTVTHAPKDYPDIYRARVGGATIYFPIDSVETVTLSGNFDNMASTYTLGGTENAEMIMDVDRIVAKAAAGQSAAADSVLKRSLGDILLRDPKSIVAYYIVNKQVGGKPLFSVDSRTDLRMIGAVANAYNEWRPNDPRTARLRDLYLQNRAIERPDTIAAAAIGHHDISLYDNRGTLRSLSDVAADHNITVLSFTSYGLETSPEYNRRLNNIYRQWHDKGLEIYQVALDNDEMAWRGAADNLPWVTVRNAEVDGTGYLLKYNVTSLPTTFVIDRHGELCERVENIESLGEAVARAAAR